MRFIGRPYGAITKLLPKIEKLVPKIDKTMNLRNKKVTISPKPVPPDNTPKKNQNPTSGSKLHHQNPNSPESLSKSFTETDTEMRHFQTEIDLQFDQIESGFNPDSVPCSSTSKSTSIKSTSQNTNTLILGNQILNNISNSSKNSISVTATQNKARANLKNSLEARNFNLQQVYVNTSKYADIVEAESKNSNTFTESELNIQVNISLSKNSNKLVQPTINSSVSGQNTPTRNTG